MAFFPTDSVGGLKPPLEKRKLKLLWFVCAGEHEPIPAAGKAADFSGIRQVGKFAGRT